jgi:hypothetical protein
MHTTNGDTLDTETRRPILRFPESADLGQLEVHDSADLTATIEYEIDAPGTTFWMRFRNSKAYRFRAEPYCTLYHLTDTYDQLIEIEGSNWLAEIQAASTVGIRALRHFMFYAESHGCLEVLADSVEHGGIPPLPPDPDL